MPPKPRKSFFGSLFRSCSSAPKSPPPVVPHDSSPQDAPASWVFRQPDGPSRPRARKEMVAGLVVPCSEGLTWMKRTLNMDLNEDHSEDINILLYLEQHLDKRGDYHEVKLLRRQDQAFYDFLVVTQRLSGKFLNTGPAWSEEAVEDDLKDKLQPGQDEVDVRVMLLDSFGIKTAGFRCIFA